MVSCQRRVGQGEVRSGTHSAARNEVKATTKRPRRPDNRPVTPVEIAAIISGCFATGSVFLTAAVAVIGFRTTRSVTAKAVAAGSQDTVRALNAARDDRLWEKRAAAYEETVAYLSAYP